MSTVPCHGCTRCCQHDLVRRLPADFDVAGRPRFRAAPHRLIQGAFMVAHPPNGDGIYRDRAAGGTIHDALPAMYRTMDGRVVARLTGTQARRFGILPIGRRGHKRRRLQPTASPHAD